MYNDIPISGGVVDHTDYNAPKEFKSDNLVSFSSSFFLYGEYGKEFDSGYGINVKNDGTKFTLVESGHNLSCETDENYLREVQNIIKKHNLLSLNGKDKHTSGLPGQFQPCYLKATYDSGEVLYFSINNNPTSEWCNDLLRLTRKEFNKHGITGLDMPASTKRVTRFNLSYTDGDVVHMFEEIRVPNKGVSKTLEQLATEGYKEGEYTVNIEYVPWDRSTDELSKNYRCEIGDSYYEGLGELIEELEIKQYTDEISAPSDFSHSDTKTYYEFYIEFEYGNRLSGFSQDLEKNKEFFPVAEKIANYIKTYMNIE